MTSLIHIPINNELPNKNVCGICIEGNNADTCIVQTLKGPSNEECGLQCQDQYNAESYYYDNNGTQRCYCGNTKANCTQYENVKLKCDDKSKTTCNLIAKSFINGTLVPEINSSETCKEQCKSIMNSSSIYCSDSNGCVCINPSMSQYSAQSEQNKEPKQNTCKDNSNQMKCNDNITDIANKSNKSGLHDNYFSIDKFFDTPDKIPDLKLVKNAFCGCDASVIAFYNTAFKDIKKEERPTLDSIWIKSVNKSYENPTPDDLETIFEKQLSIETNNEPNKLKALIAYEMCRITNNQYSRNLDKKCPDPSKNFGGWLDCHLNAKESSSGKWLNRGVKILVMTMLVHLLFRTFLPKQENIKDSLIFAMFTPPQFLQGKNREKGYVLGLSIFIMLYLMTIAYSAGSSYEVWIFFGAAVALFSCCIAFGKYKNDNNFMVFGGFGLIISCITLFVYASETPSPPIIPDKTGNPDKPDKLEVQNNSNNRVVWILIVLIIISGLLTFVGHHFEKDLLKKAWAFIPGLVFALIIINLKPINSNEGEAFINYFIPNKLKELPYSGFAFSIYAIILGAILTKAYSSFWITGIWISVMFIGILILSGMVYGIREAIVNNKDDDKNTNNNTNTNNYVKTYFIILAVFIVISGISGIIGNKGGSEYFIPYIISTVFGILPITMFLIIINFAIANYSPAIELLFLVIYRFSGFLVAMTPNSSIGKIILMIFGKRSTDKWVFPFLPMISNFIRLFYFITGDNKPGYFNGGGTITGVSNTD